MSNQKESLPCRPAEKEAITSRADEVSTVRVVLSMSCSIYIASAPSNNYVSVANPRQSF